MTKASETKETTLPGFGERLKQVRGERTQAEFAKVFRISKDMVGLYEREVHAPGITFLAEVCTSLTISPTWLLLGIGPRELGASQVIHPARATHDKTLELLTDCVQAVREVGAELGLGLTDEQAVKLGANLCVAEMEEQSLGRPPLKPAQIIQFIKRYAA
jgi:transcriptional regulator with XRE-family HTH domain